MNIKELLSEKISLVPKELVPAISLGIIIVALVLIVVFFGICVAYVNTKPKPIIKKNETDKKKDTIPPPRIRHEDLPVISGRIGEIFTLYGILKAGPVTRVFFKVLGIIKNSTYDIRWRYKLPFFMMIGPEDSGKTTLLDSLSFEHLSSENIDSMWKLFKNGAVFETPRMEASEDANKFWSFISELFVFIRPRRPLDGIIVTLPMDMLISEIVDIEKYACEIFDKIFKFQREINFHLPIYIIVTKSDLIDGFSDFAHLLSDHAKQQIFGWSCPYAINAGFSTNWIDEIFQTVGAGIRKAILHFIKNKTQDLENAVLFEANFNKIRLPLTSYINSLFRSHNPEEGLLLRGVYFVGKQKQIKEVSVDLISPTALSPTPNFFLPCSYNSDLYFVNELFEEKIFKEHNIAYPIKIDAIDMTKNEYRNKIVLATGATVFSLGWFWGNNVLKEKIQEYYHLLTSVKSTMVKIKYLESNLKGEEDQIAINKHTSTLLKDMPDIKRFDLVSVFVPQSWFSSLKNEISETLGLVFDSVVIRAMYIDLNLDTKNILQDVSNSSTNTAKKDLFDVDSFESFKKLQNFAQQLGSIERVSAEYNSIRNLEDRKSIIDLTNTLFKEQFDICKAMKTRVPSKKLISPKFDIKLFQNRIESNLKILFGNFLKDILDVTIEKILQNLSQEIEDLIEASKNSLMPYTSKDLARIYGKTVLIFDILGNKNFSWITANYFSPSKKYEETINNLESSDVIHREVVKELLRHAEIEFRKFRMKLLEYKTELTGTFISHDIKSASSDFIAFQKEIRTILDQAFICVPRGGQFSTTILEDKMLIWDIRRLKELSDLIDKYYEFTTTMPPDIRAQNFDMYKTIARKCFVPIVNAMLGNAQIFDDMPVGHSRNLLEDAYKRQANNIKSVSFALPKVIKFLDEVQAEDNIDDFGFSSTIISHYLSLLEKIDVLFNLEVPYSAGSAVFENWHGDKTPRFLDIEDPGELKQYLSAQFARIRFLAKELATPIVDLLSIPSFAEKIKDHGIINKWKEIISSVDDYEMKKPGNSIAALESFLSETLSKVSLGSIDQEGEIKTFSEKGGDFFISKRSDVAKSLLSRASIVQYEKAAAVYNQINEFFNNNLSNKFPFGKSDQEASLKDIENYIDLYEKKSKGIVEILKQHEISKKINPAAIEFLDIMDNKLINFLKIWITHSKASDANSATVTFNIQTRPSPDLEAFTSSVLDRSIAINDVIAADNSNAIFFNDNNITVTFNWVESSHEKPNGQEASGNLSIEGSKAKFLYDGKWAMFKLIEENKVNKEAESSNGIMLQFAVPIIDTQNGNAVQKAKMIMKIIPQAKEGDKFSPLAWPIFPKTCPDLHSESNPPAHEKETLALGGKASFDELRTGARE
ncbi:MAG: hypothetical protein LBF57_00250 [Holosporaceae bacterium]|jgi:type VI secretion system protein ImpL|nr:hypothetical protein [Holosporaceae bacterium]